MVCLTASIRWGQMAYPGNGGTFRITRTNGVVTAFINDTPMHSTTRGAALTIIDLVLQNNSVSG